MKEAVKTNLFISWRFFFYQCKRRFFFHMQHFCVFTLQRKEKCISTIHKTFKSHSASFSIFTKTQLATLPEVTKSVDYLCTHAEFYTNISWEWSLEITIHFHKKFQLAVKLHEHCISPVLIMLIECPHCALPSLRVKKTFEDVLLWRFSN